MSWNCTYAAFLSGLLALLFAFQAIFERFGSYALSASTTLPGIVYLLSRGLLAALAFISLCKLHLVDNAWLWLDVIATVLAVELFLRTSFYIRRMPTRNGYVEELRLGPYELLRWYESRVSEAISEALALRRRYFVERVLPSGLTFMELSEKVLQNLGGCPDPSLRKQLERELHRLQEAF